MTWRGIVGKGFRPDQFESYVEGLRLDCFNPPGFRPRFVVVHNTSAPTLANWHTNKGGPQQRMFNLEAYYRDQQHWSAGPHLFIADDLIWVFTPLTCAGVHSPSWNSCSWGVEIVGEYDEERFVGGVVANTVAALGILHESIGLDPDGMRFHKEDPLTTHKNCPGENVNKADLIAKVKTFMLAGADKGEHLLDRPEV